MEKEQLMLNMKMRKSSVSMCITQSHIYFNVNSILDFENSIKTMCSTGVRDMTILYCMPGLIIEKKHEKKTLAELTTPNLSEMKSLNEFSSTIPNLWRRVCGRDGE